MLKLFLPLDSAAAAVGANAVAAEILRVTAKSDTPTALIRTGSRGMFWLEPMLEIEGENGRRAFGPMVPDMVASLVKGGFSDDHPAALGLVDEIDFLTAQTRMIFKRCGITDPLSLDDYWAHGGMAGLDTARDMKPSVICAEIMTSGLRGRGGAAFPAGIKWNTVREAKGEQKYIVCNADEGDSGTFADRMIMEGDPFLLIEGMVIAGLAVGADKGFIYLRSEYPVAQRILGEALAAARAAGLLGGSFDIELFMGAGAYICGEETALLESLEGKRGQVRAKPPLPALEGLHGKPTLVHNVITLCAVPSILGNGGAWYRDFGTGRSTGTMPFQLAGNIKYGGLFEAPFGVSLSALVHKHGGGTRSGKPVRAVQVGGPLGAYLPASALDIPLDYEAFQEIGAGVGHGGIVVFDDTVDLAVQAKYAFDFCATESCGKCTPCRIGSVRGAEVMAKVIAGDDVADNLVLITDLCEVLEDGSLCAMGGMTPVPVLSAIKHFPEDFGGETSK
jgi:formate dehydrogenase iron-sulfur subunit